MPCRVLEAPRSLPTSPGPRSPGDISDTSADFTMARPTWYESDEATEDFDEATKDLREVLGCCKASMNILPDWLPAFDTRCLSSASTTASLSPGPQPPVSLASSPDRDLGAATSPSPPHSFVSPPSSPDRNRVASPDLLDNDIEAPTQNQQPQCPPGALDKSSWLQARKVFVGGIPQTIDQNALFHMFSKIGKVKKAWLQLFHNDRTSTSFQDPAAKKHRGFGFIIFYEKRSIDELLGTDFSRFVTFNDMKFEVKRSVGKTGAATPEPQPPATPAYNKASFAAPQTWQSSSASPAPQTWQRSPPAASPPQMWQNASPAGLQQSPQIAVPVVPQTWQQGPRQMVLVGFQAYSPLPSVPAFPFAESSAVVPDQMTSHVVALPGAISRGANPVPTTIPNANCQFLPDVLLEAFAGQLPQNNQELKMALMEALPDHYDD